MATQRATFPVPERSLPRIHVTPEQHEELRAFAVRTAHDVLRDGPTWGRSNVKAARERGWKVSQRTPGVCFMVKTTTTSKPAKTVGTRQARSNTTILRHDQNSSSSDEHAPNARKRGTGGAGGRAFMGSVRLPGFALEDVVGAIHCETTRAQRNQVSKSYGNAYLDCCVLQTLEGAKPYDPFWYLGLKWIALKSPFEKLVNHREFVYLEHSGTHVNAQGQRMLYRIIQSVCLDDFGGQDSYFGLTRAHLEAAYVYWMDGPLFALPTMNASESDVDGVLTVCMKGLAHPKGKVPMVLVERYLKRFWKAGWSLSAPGMYEESASGLPADESKMALDLATEWVADAERKACVLCHKKFRFGRRMRHHCRACGEVICRACTQYFMLTYRTSGGSVGAYPAQSNMSRASRASSSSAGSFIGNNHTFVDDEDEIPATLGDSNTSRSKRMRGASENDAVMIGKVCKRCVEMKKVAARRETSARLSSMPRKTSRASRTTRVSRRITRGHSWDNAMPTNNKPIPIHESEEHEDEEEEDEGYHHDLPIMDPEEESDAEFFVPETPLNAHQEQQFENYLQRHHHAYHMKAHYEDHDDTTSEFSIGDFEASGAPNFKPFATIKIGGQDSDVHDEEDEDPAAQSLFAQSGFSVGIHDDDDDEGEVEYHSEPESEGTIRHPQLGRLAGMAVQEEERFTTSKPKPQAQQGGFAMPAPRPSRDARLRLEDLLADTDDEGEGDYSTSPPDGLEDLDVSLRRPQPHLVRATSAPPLTSDVSRPAPPPVPTERPSIPLEDDVLASLHMSHLHVRRESTLSSISFSSFDADVLIDASALDDIEDSEAEVEEEALYARIQNIQDEVLRKQLLSSSASSVASSLSSSFGTAAPIRFRNKPAPAVVSAMPQAAAPGVSSSVSLSEASTLSSNASFLSTPSSLPDAAVPTEPPQLIRKTSQKAQRQVESSIADQAFLLQQILLQHERATNGGVPTPAI